MNMMNKSLNLSKSIKSNKKISFRILAQIASAVPKRVKFLKLISNLNNKKLISQASLASMLLPNSNNNANNNMKGFIVMCKLENK